MAESGLGTMLAGLLGWWLRGLADCLPAPRTRRRPALRFGPGGLDPGTVRRGARVTVALDPALVLAEERTWPEAAILSLGRLAAARAEAVWPLEGEGWALGFRRVHRARGPGVTLRLCLARAATLDAARAAAQAAGFRVAAFVPDGEPDLPLALPDSRPPLAGRLAAALPVLALLAFATLPGWRLASAWAEAGEAEQAAASARLLAAPALAERDALTALSAALDSLAAATAPETAPGRAIDRLAVILPTLGRIESLSLLPAEIRFAGAASSAARLLAAVQAAFPGDAARFAGPVLRDPQSGLERFEIVITTEASS
jgi:hypothetical protein